MLFRVVVMIKRAAEGKCLGQYLAPWMWLHCYHDFVFVIYEVARCPQPTATLAAFSPLSVYGLCRGCPPRGSFLHPLLFLLPGAPIQADSPVSIRSWDWAKETPGPRPLRSSWAPA